MFVNITSSSKNTTILENEHFLKLRGYTPASSSTDIYCKIQNAEFFAEGKLRYDYKYKIGFGLAWRAK
jgi:hypothetical protein